MRVVVFGGAGFLGSSVADALADAGHEVTIFDRRPSPYLRPAQRQIVGDILDEAAVARAIDGCESLYNYAGIADIEMASRDPLQTVRVNVLGNTILLDAARRAGVRRYVFASTLYVYSSAGGFYRTSKQACELVIEEYQRSYGLPFTILRYGSLYGPRADEHNWMYAALSEALETGRIVRHGDGEEIREYIHVRDAAQSSADILAPEYENSTVILSGQHPMRMKDLLAMINEMLGHRLEIEYRPLEPGSPQASLHYQITPYSFQPKIARKLIRTSYMDLGQGLLELLDQIHGATHRSDAPVPSALGQARS